MLLCGLTYAAMVWDQNKIPAQFIPMMFGIPLLFLGVVALNPHRRRASMQVAGSVAGLGGLAGSLWCFSRVLKIATGGTANLHGLTVLSVMSLLCVIFVLLCLRPFFKMSGRRISSPVVDSQGQAGLQQEPSETSTAQDVTAHDKA